ncbi:MAG: M6 family metalloprotease domain-containing protein [bacterium]|nr:M6 family metalloprotease domain-containing protein [bacterium]
MRHHAAPSFRFAILFTLAVLSLTMTSALAAPHWGDRFDLRQPDGASVPVLVWGDEFYQHIETLDGYTLVRDKATGVICYAQLSADGASLVSTGVRVGDPALSTLGLAPRLRIPLEERRRQAATVRQVLDAEGSPSFRDASKATAAVVTGNVKGITLLIDFSDQVGGIPAANFEAYLNQPGYTGYGNNGSVRDYYYDVSDGLLTYTNFVPTVYYRAAQPKTYYDTSSVTYGQRARELIREALIWLNNSGFDYSQYDADGNGRVDALNVFYAGEPTQGWAEGLWPHASSISYSADGVSTSAYQITNIGGGPSLGTFCHENGHMLCGWPDLYDYDGDSSGVGRFCLMCNGGPGNNPVEPSAPFRMMSGWSTSLTTLTTAVADLPATAGINQFYKINRPSFANEYYLIENRQRTGRDASLPDAGLAIWHVDTNGSNNNQQMTPSQHYFTTLVQADGRWDLENGIGQGDATDLWAAPDHVLFTPITSPAATWWNGAAAPLFIDGISANAPTMTFNYRPSVGSLAVTITVQPAGLLAPWSLEGPNGFVETGSGDAVVLVWDAGTYTLTWEPVPGWSLPDVPVVSGTVTTNGPPLPLGGTYLDPPFVATSAGALGDAGAGRGVSLLDHDGDGDLDLFVCNRGTASRLLRNDGNLAFTDIATGPLAEAGLTMAAAWADFDGDGDQDVYLTRDGQANRLLVAGGGTWTDIAQFGVEDAGAGRAASWVDYDNDGLLDLHLVNHGSASQVFRSFGDIGGGQFFLLGQGIAALQATGNGTAAPWADYDGDGDADIYRVLAWQANQLVQNVGVAGFMATGQMGNASAGQAAAWGDLDNDGDLDLYLVNDGQVDVFYRNQGTYFETVTGPGLGDAGPGRALALADFDNDGALDIYVARANEPDVLLFGDGTGQFAVSQLVPAALGATTAVACGDVDGDGGLDLYLSRDGLPNVLLRNAIAGRGHWLHLDLAGTGTQREAIGARVRLVGGGIAQVRHVSGGGEGLGQHARRVAFGLGAADVADSVIVRWPDGTLSVRVNVAVDQVLTIQQGVASAVEGPGALPALPAVTALGAPYPNPFNPSTTVSFELAVAGRAELAIYSLDGRRVVTLAVGDLPAGRHAAVWDGRDDRGRAVASGSYACRLWTEAGVISRRLTLVK